MSSAEACKKLMEDLPGPALTTWGDGLQAMRNLSGRSHEQLLEDHRTFGKFVRIGRHRVSISDHRALPLIYEDKKKTTLSPFYRHIDESFQCQEDDLKHGCRRARFASALEKYEAVCPHESEAVTELIDGCILDMLMHTPDLEGWRDVCLNDFVLDLVFKHDAAKRALLKKANQWVYFYGNMPAETQGDPLIGLDCSSVLAEMPRSHSEYGAWITEKLAEYSSSGEADARGPALYDLLKYTDARVGGSITNDEDKEIAADGGLILAASAENITMTILTALFHLVRSPDLLQRLVTSVSQSTRSSGQKYERSALLSAVIDESLRINPPVPGALFRELKADVRFDDVHIPKGTLVGVSAYVMHHDAANFDQPESFIPDRWLGNDVRCKREAFCPFGFGARDCVGKNLALDVTGWIIEHLLNRLEWKVEADDDENQLRYEDFFVSYPARMVAQIREKIEVEQRDEDTDCATNLGECLAHS